jgi:DNA polymerase-3 subunit delta
MAKKSGPSINEVSKYLSKEKLLPIYFLCGDEFYSIDNSLTEIRNFVEKFIHSDFDKEFINAEKNMNLNQILDLAYAFPFGGGKKLLIIKNFEKLSDKKDFLRYVNNPAEFTICLITNYGKISEMSKEPYATLIAKKYLFEARIETGDDLIDWIVEQSRKIKLGLSEDFAKGLIEIVGEDKGLLEQQLQKLLDYSVGKPKLTFDEIKRIASPTKQYSIFDLLNELGKGNKSKSIEIAFNLLDAGTQITFIISMLTKFISTIAQISELSKSNVSDNEGANSLKVSWYYYVNCKNAKFFANDQKLFTAAEALLHADLAVKTTSQDEKTILIILISEMLV